MEAAAASLEGVYAACSENGILLMTNLTEVKALDVAGFLFIYIHIPSGSPWDAVVFDITQKWSRNVVSPA